MEKFKSIDIIFGDFMSKTLLACITLAIAAILSGGFLIIPSTATLSPTMNSVFTGRPSVHFNSVANVNSLSLHDFIDNVKTGDRKSVVGVYVPGVLALPVNQQPTGQAGFVTREPDTSTQFSLARQYGTVGILAHNDLAGAKFSGIQLDEYAIIVYGDGHIEYYQIDEVQKYQALSPTSTFSDFVNLADPAERLTASQLFSRIYTPGNRLVFQTCIEAYGDPSWGRMFIIGRPATQQVKSVIDQTTHLLQFASFGLVGY